MAKCHGVESQFPDLQVKRDKKSARNFIRLLSDKIFFCI